MNKNSISYQKIQSELFFRLNQRNSENYYQELKDIFDYTISMVKDSLEISAESEIRISSQGICKKIEEDSKILLRFVDYYLRGNISSCYNSFKRWWNSQRFEYFDESYETSVFYRMRERKEGENEFSYEDLLHIPFQLRGKVTNQRYSIGGFPCLYVSTSLYQTWEELCRPYIQHLYVIAMRFTKQLSILDMRLMRDITSEKQLKCYLQRLPLIIACAVKVKNSNDFFKPEYIIPQTLLHTTKQDRIDGILYSSMKTNSTFYNKEQWNDFSKNENIVIPVKSSSEKGFCKQLQSIMEVAGSLNIEQEMIRGRIKMEKFDKYENTLLGQLENTLKTEPSRILIMPNGLKGGISFGLIQSIQMNPIMHLLK